MAGRVRWALGLLAGALALVVGLAWVPAWSPVPPCCLRRALASVTGALRPALLMALPLMTFFRRGFFR